jgi:hypothetical protein
VLQFVGDYSRDEVAGPDDIPTAPRIGQVNAYNPVPNTLVVGLPAFDFHARLHIIETHYA